jgi:UMP-CMP kinase
MHYSVGDSLRNWMRDNRGTTLAVRIKHRLDNQGFLTFEDLMPFLCQAIMDAINHDAPKYRGIIIDGFPGCTDQLHAVDAWLSQDNPPLTIRDDNQVGTNAIPSIVFSLQATKHNAKIRYLSRGRDGNDSAQKFENRFTEYEQETVPVEETYKQRGILISVGIRHSSYKKQEADDKLDRHGWNKRGECRHADKTAREK